MKWFAVIALVCLSLAPGHAENAVSGKGNADALSAGNWTEEFSASGLVIYSRARNGSALREFKGVGVIDAMPQLVLPCSTIAKATLALCPTPRSAAF